MNIFGFGNDLDAFFASNTINFIIVAISSGAINSAITPIFIRLYKNDNKSEFAELASSMFNIIFILFMIFGFVQYIFAEQILKVILPGFSDSELVQVVFFLRIQAFLSVFTILTALLLALHYTYKNFYRTIIYPTVGQLAQILFVWLFHEDIGVYALVCGLVINQLLSFVLLSLPFLKIYKLKIIYNEELKNANRIILPLIISSGFSKSNILVDRFFASTLSSGSITFLQYGEKIIQVISGFINKGISLVSLRKFVIEQDKEEEFQRLFYLIHKTIIFIVVPVSFFIIFFLHDALNAILASSKLSIEDVEKIYWVTIAFLGIFIGGSLNSTVTNAFYAKGLTKIVSNLAIVFQTLGIGFKILLFYEIGFWGLPIAMSINSILAVVCHFVLYNKYIYKYSLSLLVKYLFMIVIITSTAMVIAKLLNEIVYINVLLESIFFVFGFIFLARIFENEISKLILIRLKFIKQ